MSTSTLVLNYAAMALLSLFVASISISVPLFLDRTAGGERSRRSGYDRRRAVSPGGGLDRAPRPSRELSSRPY